MSLLCIAASSFLLLGAAVLSQDTKSVPNAPQPQITQNMPSSRSLGSEVNGDECFNLMNQGTDAISKLDYSAAATVLRKELLVCPNQSDILLKLAKVEMLSEQFNAADQSLQRLLSVDPQNIEALNTQGELFYLMGKMPDAEASLIRAIAAAPSNATTHYLLGRIYYQQSNVSQAKEQFQAALHLDPYFYKAYDGLALCYENSGETQLAVQSYIKGIELVYKDHPDYGVIYADFAELMLRFNENQQAFNLAAEAAKREPNRPRNFLLSGRALAQAGEYQHSIRWLQRATQMDPTYADPHYQLARVYRKLGDLAESKREADLCATLVAHQPKNRR